jgi:hypothetical protein
MPRWVEGSFIVMIDTRPRELIEHFWDGQEHTDDNSIGFHLINMDIIGFKVKTYQQVDGGAQRLNWFF